MVEVEIYRSKVEGTVDVVLYRKQVEVAGYQTLRFRLVRGVHELSDLSVQALRVHFGVFIYDQVAASGKLG